MTTHKKKETPKKKQTAKPKAAAKKQPTTVALGQPAVLTPQHFTTWLPLFLAGPIVRRAEPSEVWFWLACSEEVLDCTPTLMDAYGTAIPLAKHETAKVMQIGERIWIVLASARPASGAFPSDALIQYDLEIASSNPNLEQPIDLQQGQAGFGEGPAGTAKVSRHVANIAYPPYQFPAFVLGDANRRLVHGSCRRVGADGPDAFLAFDTWMTLPSLAASTRPSAILLTGDQIYADDLAQPLFGSVLKLATDVFGYAEQIPNPNGDGTNSYAAMFIANYQDPAPEQQPPNRKWLTSLGKSPWGFTTDDGEGHLLTLPEYSALYLIGWNAELCAAYLSADDQTNYRSHNDYPMTGFTAAAAAARRVLANCASYMILDDHDVTDDWNIDADWVQNTTTSKTGRRVIANALGAAFAFQTWGNDPRKYDDAFISSITDHLAQVRQYGVGAPGSAAPAFDKTLLERHWSFIVPTAQPVLCFDTRTQREFPSTNDTAILSGPTLWPDLQKLAKERNLVVNGNLVVVLATPLLMHASAVWGQNHKFGDWRTGGDKNDKYSGDYELYPNYPLQRPELIRFLHDQFNPDTTVIFSGDVHHGFVIDGLYGQGDSAEKIYGEETDWTMRVIQICASAIKNMEKTKFVDDPTWHGLTAPTDVGNIGESIMTLWELDDTKTSALRQLDAGGNAVAIDDGKTIAMRAATMHLSGDLGRYSYIYENNLCVVDMPVVGGENVAIRYVGAKYSDPVDGLIGDAVGVVRQVVGESPQQRVLVSENFPGSVETATVELSTKNGPELFRPSGWGEGQAAQPIVYPLTVFLRAKGFKE